MEIEERRKRKAFENEYLNKYIFYGLKDQNIGFDVGSIKYFSAVEFAIVLDRIEQHKIGINGIEPWYQGEYFAVSTYEDYTSDASDPKWYRKAFKEFTDLSIDLQYAASYHVPDEELKKLEIK